jgi:hypothetical protein
VKILGSACGLGVEGSGWVAGDGLVVTNAHVVAGQKDTEVLLRGRPPASDALVVAFDPRNDIAVLRVKGLDAPALQLVSSPRSGTAAAILGFPGNGPYDVRAGAALDHLAARRGALRQLRRADGRRPGARGRNGLRGDHERTSRWLCRTQRDRALQAGSGAFQQWCVNRAVRRVALGCAVVHGQDSDHRREAVRRA